MIISSGPVMQFTTVLHQDFSNAQLPTSHGWYITALFPLTHLLEPGWALQKLLYLSVEVDVERWHKFLACSSALGCHFVLYHPFCEVKRTQITDC